jgi:hypothetical protein
MKKILLPILMLLAMVGTSKAQGNALTVANIDLPQNSVAELKVNFQFDADRTYTAYSFDLQLPDDLEFVTKKVTEEDSETGEEVEIEVLDFTKGSCHDGSHSVTANLSEGVLKVAGLSLDSKPLKGTSGVLLTFVIKPKTSSLQVGKPYTGTISNILLVPVEGAKQNLTESNFTVTIGEPVELRTVLDENSTTPPTAAEGVDVRVNRTINAGNWSTICLPFDMTETQVKTAFGNDVQLAEFKGWESKEFDNDDNTVRIEVSFKAITSIKANIPCIIKISNNLTSFTVDDVDIDADDEPSVIVGKMNRGTFGSFTGTYVPLTIDEESLFLNGNKFWYSTGSTKMKGFRAYFYFQDLLVDYTDKTSNARVYFSVTDDGSDATKIDARTMEPIETGKVYNMAGQYVGEGEDMNRLPKGIYIVNGKKVIK